MKRFLISLLFAFNLPTAVEANWFGKYGSLFEAKKACYEWGRKSGIESNKWDCFLEEETQQYLGIEEYSVDGNYDPKVKKRFKY